MHAGRLASVLGFTLGCLLLSSAAVAAERHKASAPQTAGKAQRFSRVPLPQNLTPTPTLSSMDSMEVMVCFDGTLNQVVNPGCFAEIGGGGGDCSSSSSHFMAQFFDPFDFLGDFPGTWRVREVAWITNDGDTQWPSVGIVLKPFDNVTFPTSGELNALQMTQIASPGDTAEVVVDMRPANITFDVDNVLYMVLQFPEGGILNAPLDGPGILAEDSGQDPNCDFLTHDTGANWLAPDTNTDPLDWGFAVVIEPATAIEQQTWGRVKLIYGGSHPAAQRTPQR